MRKVVYLNGSFVPENEAKVSIRDRGLLYGDALFETMRVYGGVVFRLHQHLERLFRSAEIIGLLIPIHLRRLAEAARELIRRNDFKDGYIRLSISRGKGQRGIDPIGCNSPTMTIDGERSLPYPQEVYERGYRAIIVGVRQNEFSPLAKIKSANFLNNILAKIEAKTKEVEDGILLNTQGFVAEATTSNIFLIMDRDLLTPPEDAGILTGITRGVVMDLAPRLGLRAIEKDISLSELKGAEESFLTNSLMELMPLVEVDGQFIGDGSPGPKTKQLHRAYKELVAKETVRES